MTTATQDLAAALERMAAVLDTVRPLDQAFTDLVARRRAAGRGITRDALAELREPICAVLLEHPHWVAGAGVVTARGLLVGRPLHLEWWWRNGAARPEPLRVNLDEGAADFFDYTSAEWFAAPASTGLRHAAGPYVDYLCTNLYSVTLTSPVLLDGQLVGVVGADVPVRSLEAMVLPLLARIDEDAALVTASGRVVVSASAAVAPGHRIDLDRVRSRPALPPMSSRGAAGSTGGLDGWVVATAR